jgi:nucleoside-diphosphate-sugar epimerase
MTMSTTLVTGGSGFIGSHCILQLLAAGHRVRTTVRSLKREGDVRALLKQGGAEPGDRLDFIAAELENDAGWSEAVAGCDCVLHVASPFPPYVPKHEDELIVPAREGTLRWLVRIVAMRDPAAKQILPELGKVKNATNQKARRVLGWAPRSNEESIVATAESLLRLGLLKDSAHRAPKS